MIIAINYANQYFAKSQKLNSITAKVVGKVNRVISYGPNNIDLNFKEINSEILSINRGDGLWLWKPYFIKTTLDKMNEGDYLIYTDSGMMYMRNINNLISKMQRTQQDIFLTDIPLLEVQFTHPEVIKSLKSEHFKYTNQIQAGLIILKKTRFSQSFIDEWLKQCQNINLLRGNGNNSLNETLYKEHREDQSILSVLSKKFGVVPFNDVTDYGRFPLQYLNADVLFHLEGKEKQFFIDKTYFLLYRKENPLVYLSKYLMKRILSFFGLTFNTLTKKLSRINT